MGPRRDNVAPRREAFPYRCKTSRQDLGIFRPVAAHIASRAVSSLQIRLTVLRPVQPALRILH
jgi:hypothetical protein